MDKEKIREKIKELTALLEEPEDTKNTGFKLELNTGGYFYHGDGAIYNNGAAPRLTRCFNSFKTREQIEIAVKRKSAQDELLQMAFILNGDWKPNFAKDSERKYYIYYGHKFSDFFQDYNLSSSFSLIYFKIEPLEYFLATASDNLKAYIKGELQ